MPKSENDETLSVAPWVGVGFLIPILLSGAALIMLEQMVALGPFSPGTAGHLLRPHLALLGHVAGWVFVGSVALFAVVCVGMVVVQLLRVGKHAVTVVTR